MATRFLVMKARPEQTAFLVVCPRMYGIVVFDVADLAAESKLFLLTNYDSMGGRVICHTTYIMYIDSMVFLELLSLPPVQKWSCLSSFFTRRSFQILKTILMQLCQLLLRCRVGVSIHAPDHSTKNTGQCRNPMPRCRLYLVYRMDRNDL